MTDRINPNGIYQWAADTMAATNAAMEQLKKGVNVEDQIITNWDDWKYKSDAEKRRWAAEKLEFYRELVVAGGDQPVSFEEMFKRADLLIAYINGPSVPSEASSVPGVPHSSPPAAEQSQFESSRAA